jgi:hypothetical protein
MISLAPSQFELWAQANGYDAAPAVSPTDIRKYADRNTQAAFDAWIAGARSVARKLTEPTHETETLRDGILRLAGSE